MFSRFGGPDIFLNVEGVREDIFLERTGKLSSVSYVLDIRPLLVFKNCLPVTLHYGFSDAGGQNSEDFHYMEPGRSAHLQGVRFGETRLVLKIFEFRGTDWVCERVIDEEMPQLVTWRFSSVGDSQQGEGAATSGLKLDLQINSTVSHGTQVLSVFAPFWMVNKTGKMLTYRGQDPQNVIYHPVELEGTPMMFSYVASSFLLGKRKSSLRIEDSAWSEPFTLDTIEDAGKVTCKRPGVNPGSTSKSKCSHSVGVNIAMSRSSLTKIITFTPYYIIVNTAEFSVSVRELDGDCDPVEVPSGESVPFWPMAGASRMVASVTGTPQLTSPFTLTQAHSTLLALGNRFGGIHADCRKSHSETLLTLSSYSRGLAPVQLVNATSSCTIEYCEKDAPAHQALSPGDAVYYTWVDPSGSRSLSWSVSGYREEYTDALMADGEGVIELDVGQYLAWVSFLDGMQRVLLFTEDPNLCYHLSRSTGEFERIEQEIEVSIHGVGISVVNNGGAGGRAAAAGEAYEVLYTSVTSSDIVWEVRRTGKTR